MIEGVEVVVRQPGYPDRIVQLHQGATRIGRAEDNELVLSDVGVSRRHAQIYWSAQECLVEDLGSGNGTYHRGRRVQSQPLLNGDEIVIDPFVLLIRLQGHDVPSAPQHTEVSTAGARLDVVVGTGMAGSSYPITARGLSIGRSEDRDVVIPDPAASRHHCQISQDGQAYTLRDLGSANGVFLNGVRVREEVLNDGDIVRIGNTEMRFSRARPGERDSTTQVHPAGAELFQNRTAPTAAAAKSPSSSLFVVGVIVMLLGAFTGLVALAIGGYAAMNYEAPPPPLAERPLAWSLKLPSGLKGGTTDEIFVTGTQQLGSSDHVGALQNFYRVLVAAPNSADADKFALAAGEALLLDELEDFVAERATEQADANAHKTRLLGQVRRGGRPGRQAEAALREQFREDPDVVEAMRWSPTEGMQKRDEAMKSAATAVASEDWAEAARLYQSVLDDSRDPDQRLVALGGLKTSQRELARAVSASWTEAVMARALGAEDDAVLWSRVTAVDPQNPCATSRAP